ncbi:hypothetical protein Hanom_Chr02g00155511 [Helianthus anomalus]
MYVLQKTDIRNIKKRNIYLSNSRHIPPKPPQSTATYQTQPETNFYHHTSPMSLNPQHHPHL